MKPDELFECKALRCKLLTRVCVRRQVESEVTYNADRPLDLARHDGKRGIAPEYPTCATSRCAQGRSVLHALVERVIADVKSGDRSDLSAQRRAFLAQRRVSPPEVVPVETELFQIPHDDLVESGPVCITSKSRPRLRMK